MEFSAPYVLYGALRASREGLLEPHVRGYRKLLEAVRDNRYDLEAAVHGEVVSCGDLPLLAES
jgi:hypothetical protein